MLVTLTVILDNINAHCLKGFINYIKASFYVLCMTFLNFSGERWGWLDWRLLIGGTDIAIY